MKTKIYFQITYTNRYTFERITYMKVGYETKEDAKKELDIIKKEKLRLKKLRLHTLHNCNSAVFAGINFRIKKVKCIVATLN